MPDDNKKPKGAIQAVKEQLKPLEFSDYKLDPQKDIRADGSLKGKGFLGPLKRPDGGVSSEVSIGVNLNGKEIEIPTLVPTLKRHELNYILSTPSDKLQEVDPKLYKSIVDKAVEHAKTRLKAGMSPFAEEAEAPKAPPELE